MKSGSIAVIALAASACAAAPPKPAAQVTPDDHKIAIADGDQITILRMCGRMTDCAGWRVEASPDGRLRVEGVDGVAAHGVTEVQKSPSIWMDALRLVEAFDWSGFQRAMAADAGANCGPAIPDFRVMIRWTAKGAQPREASIGEVCSDGAAQLAALEQQLEVLFLGPPPRHPPS